MLKPCAPDLELWLDKSLIGGVLMTALTRTIRVLLMTTEIPWAEDLAQELAPHGFSLRHTPNREACLVALRTTPADVLLLTGEDGRAFCRQLRTQGNDLPVVLLNEQDDMTARVAALDAGASDLVGLPIQLNDLLISIRSQLQRPSPINDQVLEFLDVRLNFVTREVWRKDRSIECTTKEYDLLRFLMENPQQVLSREQILQQVWGEDFTGESNIIEVYIRYLRLKLEHDGERKIIQTVRGIGYALRE